MSVKLRNKVLVLPYNLLTAQEYADLAGVTLTTAYRRAQAGAIEVVMWRGRQLFVADMGREPDALVDLDAVLEYRETHGDPIVNAVEGEFENIEEELR